MILIKRIQQRRVLSIFKHAAKSIPFYRKYLEQLNIDFRKVKSIQVFKNIVPILNKDKLFTPQNLNIRDYLSDNLKAPQSIFPSSGFSGKFSFGLVSKEETKKQSKTIDYSLDHAFDTTHKKTLLINALSMGINIPTSKATIVNTGLRSDIVFFIIRRFAKEFDQIILIGENSFIKNLLEQGLEEGLSWQDYDIHIIFGGESFPESFRTYIEHLVGIAPDDKRGVFIGSSFGCAEIGLNLLWETPQTIQIRKRACFHEKLRVGLLGEDTPLCPIFFQHNPLNIYIEELNGKLLFTSLNPKALLPIIRYDTGDEGLIIPFNKLKKALKDLGLKQYTPKYRLPLIAVKSRGQYIDFNGNKIYPDMVKNALYSRVELPKLITGYFRMKKNDNRVGLEVQLKKKVAPTKEIEDKFKSLISKFISIDFDLVLYPYNEFPYAMELDFERKFKYI